jgi:hypothetical protein
LFRGKNPKILEVKTGALMQKKIGTTSRKRTATGMVTLLSLAAAALAIYICLRLLMQ